MRLTVASVAFALTALSAHAQESAISTIIVQGRGRAEAPPDAFFIAGQLRGQGADQSAALRALAETQGRMSDGLARMDGLSGARLLTQSVEVEPVYAPGCRADSRDRDSSGCTIQSYTAGMSFQFKGAPASEAGNAVSLASELGAQNVGTSGTHLEDDAALRAEARRLAFADAEEQARSLAEASGRRIVRIVRIQNADARMNDYEPGSADEVVVTGSRIRPSVAIPVEHPPVRVDVRLNVAFEIE
ncbi:MAG: DUF541 domain-containing protein [Brevundimonas sp.]|nr:MAG: DUF541 domain-containing protein [Brevundimonas sp.]